MGFSNSIVMNGNSLNKDIILTHTNCNDIYTRFLGRTDFPQGNISSPFSEDKNPSFKLYKNGTFKCNSSGKQGDVFQFVADLKQLDSKTQFKEVLQLIAIEMNIQLQENYNTTQVNPKSIQKHMKSSNSSATKILQDNCNGIAMELQDNCNDDVSKIAIENEPKKLSIAIRDFTTLDLEYWNKLGVNKTILEKYKVHSISNYCWTGKKPIYTKNESVAFAFELDGNFKLYIPNQADIGIKKNVLPAFPNSAIFGLEQLAEKVENLIICEGEKDTIVANSRGFNTVTFGSCSIHSKQQNINLLQLRCNNLFVCFDADETGITGMQNLIKSNPEIIPIYLPKNDKIKGYDLTDYFQEYNAQDFQKIIDLAVKNKNDLEVSEKSEAWTIFHTAEKYLTENYDIRLNIISNEIEISNKNLENWNVLNENSIYRELQKKSIKIPKLSLVAILMSDFVPRYNPFTDYFENLPKWDLQTDYIKQFSEYVTLATNENKEHFTDQFKKWCVRVVKCAIEPNFFNKEAFIITDNGVTSKDGEIKQSMGKTSWCRFLCPPKLSKYITQNVSSIEKDALSSLCNNFIINLDELDNMGKFSLNKLKSLFSLDNAKLRLPYDKRDSVFPRVASFIGSTNEANFLYDETGSARWICFVVEGINWKYREEFNINNLWAQAVYLLNDINFIYTIGKEELRLNEERNDKFQIVSAERDLINRLFRFPKNFDEADFLTATDIVEHIHLWSTGIKINPVAVGKALKKSGYNRTRVNQQWGYYIVKINS